MFFFFNDSQCFGPFSKFQDNIEISTKLPDFPDHLSVSFDYDYTVNT